MDSIKYPIGAFELPKEITQKHINTYIEELGRFPYLLEEAVKQYMEAKSLGFGQVMPPLRLALVGELKGPHVFDIIEVIGKEDTLRRLDALLSAEK